MAKAKTKPDSKLYSRLRDSGVRKKVAARAAEALPTKGSKKPSLAHGIAAELTKGRRLDQGARRRGLAQALEGSQEGRANAQGERGKESALRAQGRENSFWFVRQSALRQRRRRPAPGSPATTPFSPLRSSEGVPGVGLGRGLDLARWPAVSKNEAVGR